MRTTLALAALLTSACTQTLERTHTGEFEPFLRCGGEFVDSGPETERLPASAELILDGGSVVQRVDLSVPPAWTGTWSIYVSTSGRTDCQDQGTVWRYTVEQTVTAAGQSLPAEVRWYMNEIGDYRIIGVADVNGATGDLATYVDEVTDGDSDLDVDLRFMDGLQPTWDMVIEGAARVDTGPLEAVYQPAP